MVLLPACLMSTVDTDVIVIIVGKFYGLLQQQPAAAT